MFEFNGKRHYSITNAIEKTGYDEETIVELITSNKIEGDLIMGSWALTETGMKQLEVRKKRIDSQPKPAEEPKPEPKEMKPDKTIHFRTPDAIKVYDRLVAYAEQKGTSPREAGQKIIDEFLTKVEPVLSELSELETRRSKLLEMLQ